MAKSKGKGKGNGADVLFRIGVQSHPGSAKAFADLRQQATEMQSTFDASMKGVARHATSATDKIRKEVELLNRGFGREQLAAFRASSDVAKSLIESTGAAIVGQIRAAGRAAAEEINRINVAPRPSVNVTPQPPAIAPKQQGTGTLPNGDREGASDRARRILNEYGTHSPELDRKVQDMERPARIDLPIVPPSSATSARRAPVVSQATKDDRAEASYDNKQRERGILDKLRQQEREEKAIAKRTAEFKLDWQKRVENAQRAGLEDDSKFMQLSASEQEAVIKKREGLKKQFYANQSSMAKQAAAAEQQAEKKVENARRAGLEGDRQFMNLSVREQEVVIKKREALKGQFYKNQIKMSREAAAAEREAAASVSAAQVEAVAKAQAIQNQYTSSRRALMGSLAESTASVMQLARGIGMLGLVGEENMEDFVKGLAKLQGTFDVVVGGMQSIQRLSGVWTNLRSMMDAASAASAVGGAKSAAMQAALAREAVAANAAATAYMRLNAGRSGGAVGSAANAAGRVATGVAGRAATGAAGRAAATGAVGLAGVGATGAAATGGVASGAAGAGAATGGMSAATIGVPVAAAIAAVASSVLAGIVTKDFAKGIGSSGFGGGMAKDSTGDRIATAEVKFLSMLDKMAAKTGLSSEARGGAIDALIGPLGAIIPGLNGFGKALTGLTDSAARLERAEKARADSKERMLKELEQHRREMDLNRQRTEQRDELAFQANDVKRFVANADQEDKQSALDRKIAGEKRSLEHDRNPAEFAARSQKIAGLEKQKRDSGADFLSPEMLEKRTLLIKKQQDALEDLAKVRQHETDAMNSSGNLDASIRELEAKKSRTADEKAALEDLIATRERGNQSIKDADDRSKAARKEVLAIEGEIAKARLQANRQAIADLHREIELRGQIAEMERGRIDNARQKFGQMDASDQKKLVLAAERVRKEGMEFDRTGMNKADRDKIGAAKTEYTAAQKELAESGDSLKTLKTGKGLKFSDAEAELQAAREASKEAAGGDFAAKQAAAKRLKAAQESFQGVSQESRDILHDPDRKAKLKAAEERDAAAKERMAKAMTNRDMTQFDVAQTQQEKRKRDGEVNTIKAKQQNGIPISGDEQQKLADAENRRRDAIAAGLSREDRQLVGASGLREGEDIERRGFGQSADAGGFGRVEAILGGDEKKRANDADRNKRQLQDEVVARESQNRNTVQDHESQTRPSYKKLTDELNAEITMKTDVKVDVKSDFDEVKRVVQNSLNEHVDRKLHELSESLKAEKTADQQARSLEVTQVTAQRKAGIPR